MTRVSCSRTPPHSNEYAAVWERALQRTRFSRHHQGTRLHRIRQQRCLGLSRLADLIAARLRALGGEVRQVAPPADMVRSEHPHPTRKRVVAQFRGSGTEEDSSARAHGHGLSTGDARSATLPHRRRPRIRLGIADNNRVSHLSCIRCRCLRPVVARCLMTVLINADEEVSSPASRRSNPTQLGAEHDLVLSCEGFDGDANPAVDDGDWCCPTRRSGTCFACRARRLRRTQRALRSLRTRYSSRATCQMPLRE